MKQICFLFFFITISLQAQFQVNGIVKDFSTNKPLPFATITTNEGINFISDVDGKFSISSKKKFNNFDVSYIGYLKTVFPEVNLIFGAEIPEQVQEIVAAFEKPYSIKTIWIRDVFNMVSDRVLIPKLWRLME